MQRENILDELEFSNSGCTDENCQFEIGKLLQARQMIVGSMGTFGNMHLLNIKLVEYLINISFVGISALVGLMSIKNRCFWTFHS